MRAFVLSNLKVKAVINEKKYFPVKWRQVMNHARDDFEKSIARAQSVNLRERCYHNLIPSVRLYSIDLTAAHHHLRDPADKNYFIGRKGEYHEWLRGV